MIRRNPIKRSPLKRGLVAVSRKRAKPRRGPMRDPGYLVWLRERACVACITAPARLGFLPALTKHVLEHTVLTDGSRAFVCDPAHGPVNGRGSKGSDHGAIPLCRHHHDEQHRVGWPAFEARYGFSREKEAATHYAAYLLVRDAGGKA